jgi:hypothetical protein
MEYHPINQRIHRIWKISESLLIQKQLLLVACTHHTGKEARRDRFRCPVPP